MSFPRYVVFPSLALATVAGLASALPSVASELFPAPADTRHRDTPAVLLVQVTRATALHPIHEAGHRPESRPEQDAISRTTST
ncbi:MULTISPECIES: hypothetical protein [Streptomyces]|uniref:Secreted protein n=1 Tax=Streptomyces spinosisporus TaxID=2927582 RepID=A0ABS9XQ67_9ACTN|nr:MULTISPECIES: hypothetical protein [Streptomyces]EPD63572.1 hypothetical protein HMPREF1211_02699 [Streptomyces sp. HGB0020]MCI3244075.1 hypothetical protein [Streptomyces spinosisporus]